jgi:tape measure domain-containing protein
MADDNKTLELQIRIAAQEAVRAVASLKGEIQTLASEAKKFSGTEGAALKKSFKDAEDGAKDLASSIGDIKKAVGSLAEVAALAKALSVIKDMGAFALQTADNFQTMKNQFGVLLGDMEAGAGLFNEIKAFNDVTPFDLDTLTQATDVLISAKVPLNDLQNQLTKFGDLSQGNSRRMTSYVNAFSQAAAKGKADMQVLNTYLHQGVPILDALAKNFNVTTAEIVKMSGEGEISFRDFSKALDDLTASGGQYFGGMELASKSLAAMQAGLNEAANTLAASFGDMLLPAATAIVGALTEMANAINDNPMVKGVFAAALILLTGYLANLALQAAITFARQMALNFAIGAMNPVVLAATVAAAALAAGYVALAAKAQDAKRKQEDFALALRQTAGAAREYADAFAKMSAIEIGVSLQDAKRSVVSLERQLEAAQAKQRQLQEAYAGRRGDGRKRKELEDAAEAVTALERRLELAKAELKAVQEGREELRNLTPPATELPPVKTDDSAAKAAKEWRERWDEEWRRFREQDNPFIDIEIAWDEKKLEAAKHGAQELLGDINEYYQTKWHEVAGQLIEEEERLLRSLSESKRAELDAQREAELEQLRKLETARIISARQTGEDILKIAETYAGLEAKINDKYDKEKDKARLEEAKARLEEAKASLVDWQQSLGDTLTLALLDLESFGDGAAAVLGDLAGHFANLSVSAGMTGIEEFGKALGKGADAGKAWSDALAAMSLEVLNALPNLFLQAGLQLIATPGMWPTGLALIAAAGATQFTKGYVSGRMEQERSRANAHGGVYDEYGEAARAFAAGGTFTNQIVREPTYFRHGGGLGLMGEAGPEAIMPLARMPNGDLGVQTAGSGANVTVNVINNSGAEVRLEETENADGSKQIDVIIGGLVNNHIASGKADRVIAGRYGLRAGGA